MVADANQRLRFAVTLHTTAVTIFDHRARARPPPHRCGGYTDAELAKKDPHPPTIPLDDPAAPLGPLESPPLSDEDAQRLSSLHGDPAPPAAPAQWEVDDYDLFNLGGDLDGPCDEPSAPPAQHGDTILDPPVVDQAEEDAQHLTDRRGVLRPSPDDSDGDYDPLGLGRDMDNPRGGPPGLPSAQHGGANLPIATDGAASTREVVGRSAEAAPAHGDLSTGS